MAYTSAANLGRLLMGELNNNAAFNAGKLSIANLTNQQIKNTLGRFATTGLSRSGISGAALAQINKAAGESYGKLAGEQADRRSQIIQQLLGLYQGQIENERSESGFGDILGGGLGLLLGSALGPVGAVAGGALGGLLTGKKSSGGGGGSLFMPSIEKYKYSKP